MSVRRTLVVLLLAGLTLGSTATAATAAEHDLEAARAAQAEAARRYRESLEALLSLQESAVQRASADAERRRALLAEGLIAPAELEMAERALGEAQAAAARTRTALHEAETLVAEAEPARELAALPPPAPGETQERPSVIRYAGSGRWSLAVLPGLERFFATRFGHPLPVSALGQTAVHDRLGFDHRNALDVAVHPDSPEGRALMDYLRAQKIPFLAFRAAQRGVATGAHVHVGEPSARLSSASTITGP
jgi:hypothetical protein